MNLTLAHIGAPKSAKQAAANPKLHYESLTRMYVDRISSYHPIQVEAFATEIAFVGWLHKQAGRVPATLILLDSAGRQLSSAAFAQWLGKQRDQGAQHLIFAIGPHHGWSTATLALARQPGMLLSFGPITLPHELARLVLAEQVYRACTILEGHPYHSGH